MKITAEFNSNEELLNFINTFGAKTVQETISVNQLQKDIEEMIAPKVQPVSVEPTKEDDKKEPVQADPVKEDPKDEETKVTIEMVRAIFKKLIQAGKAKEAKELTGKYGASKIPEIKEEDYAAIYKEAEGLL